MCWRWRESFSQICAQRLCQLSSLDAHRRNDALCCCHAWHDLIYSTHDLELRLWKHSFECFSLCGLLWLCFLDRWTGSNWVSMNPWRADRFTKIILPHSEKASLRGLMVLIAASWSVITYGCMNIVPNLDSRWAKFALVSLTNAGGITIQ